MEPKQIFFINDGLYYMENGQWVPYRQMPIAVGGGSGGGLSRNSVIRLINQFSGGGVNVEGGSFSRTALQGSGAQIVPTTKKIKLIFLNTIFTSDNAVSGSGISDGTNQSCLPNQGNTTFASQTDCINIDDGGGGFSAKILLANITDTSFQVDWTIIGAGENVTVLWQAVTE